MSREELIQLVEKIMKAVPFLSPAALSPHHGEPIGVIEKFFGEGLKAFKT